MNTSQVDHQTEKQFHRSELFVYFGIAVVIIWSFLMLPSAYYGGAEGGLPFYNLTRLFEMHQTTWYPAAMGAPINIFHALYPFYLIHSTLHILGIPETVLQYITFAFHLVLAAIGISKLARRFFESSRPGAIVCALFYLFNSLAYYLVWSRVLFAYISLYHLLPILAYLLLRWIQTRKLVYLIVLAIIDMTLGFYRESLPAIIVMLMALTMISCVYCISFRKIKSFFALFAFLSIWLICNAWWILPFQYTLNNTPYLTKDRYSYHNNRISFIGASSQHGNLWDIVRLTTDSLYKAGSTKATEYYAHPLVRHTFLFPFAALLALFFIRKKPSRINLLLCIYGPLIFLMKGSHEPWAAVNLWLFDYIPLMSIFRNPFEKFGLMLPLIMALIVGFTTSRIYQLISTRSPRGASIYLLATICIVIAPGYPILSGIVLEPTVNIGDTQFDSPKLVVVPRHYQAINDYLQTDTDVFRVLVSPFTIEGSVYLWKRPYIGAELSNKLLNYPSISSEVTYPFLHETNQAIIHTLKHHPDDVPALLGLMNVKYVLDREKEVHPITTFDNLSTLSSIQLEKTQPFGDISLGRISQAIFKQKVYLSQNPLLVSDQEKLTRPGDTDLFTGKYDAIVIGNRITSPYVSGVVSRITQENPARYRVKVENLQQVTPLIFLEAYHPLWRAYYADTGEYIPDKNHSISNIFANGWTIERKGSFDLLIEFDAERHARFGLLLSLIASGILACFVVVQKKSILKIYMLKK